MINESVNYLFLYYKDTPMNRYIISYTNIYIIDNRDSTIPK